MHRHTAHPSPVIESGFDLIIFCLFFRGNSIYVRNIVEGEAGAITPNLRTSVRKTSEICRPSSMKRKSSCRTA